MFWLGFTIGLFVGGFFGMLIVAFCKVAGRGEEWRQ